MRWWSRNHSRTAQWVTIYTYFSTIHTFIDSDLNKAARAIWNACCYCSHQFSLSLPFVFNSFFFFFHISLSLLKAQLLIIASLLLCWSFCCLDSLKDQSKRERDDHRENENIMATISTHIELHKKVFHPSPDHFIFKSPKIIFVESIEDRIE